MKIRGGKFDAALGRKASHGGFTFVACAGGSDGSTFDREFRLEAHVDEKRAPPILRPLLRDGIDAAWVRARLPRVFDYAVGDPEAEKTLFWESFAAVRGDDAIVFSCADYYGRTGLLFAESISDEDKRTVARAFWDLLLETPDNLEDYELRTYHSGAGVWMTYACRDGEITMDEEPG